MFRSFSCLLIAASIASAGPKAKPIAAQHHFESVLQGQRIQHQFVLRNEGDEALRITGASVTPLMKLLKSAAVIPPGGETQLAVAVETADLAGDYEGELRVQLNDPAMPEVVFTMRGRVVPPIEFKPMAAFYAPAEKGKGASRSIEILGNDGTELQILEIKHTEEFFTTRLETLESGRRYRLTLNVLPDGPVGRHTEKIEIRTNHPKHPVLFVEANTWLRYRVFAFPEKVDFGAIPTAQVQAGRTDAPGLVQVVMLHSSGAKEFKAGVTSSDPLLRVRSQAGPTGDRYQIWVYLDPVHAKPGPIKAQLIIETNDKEFPRLEIPVGGELLNPRQ